MTALLSLAVLLLALGLFLVGSALSHERGTDAADAQMAGVICLLLGVILGGIAAIRWATS